MTQTRFSSTQQWLCTMCCRGTKWRQWHPSQLPQSPAQRLWQCFPCCSYPHIMHTVSIIMKYNSNNSIIMQSNALQMVEQSLTPHRHSIGHFGGGLHSQSLDWYWQTKLYRKINMQKLKMHCTAEMQHIHYYATTMPLNTGVARNTNLFLGCPLRLGCNQLSQVYPKKRTLKRCARVDYFIKQLWMWLRLLPE